MEGLRNATRRRDPPILASEVINMLPTILPPPSFVRAASARAAGGERGASGREKRGIVER